MSLAHGAGAARPAPAPSSPATRALLALIVPVSVAGLFFPGVTGLLAKVNDRLLAGELWRLVTPALVHGSGLHLLVNAMALNQVGRLAELFYGPGRFLAVFVVGTAGATLASVAWTEAPSVGASGGLFAVVGALLAFGVRERGLPEELRKRLVRDELFVIGVNLAFGLMVPYVDNAAHLGGLATGFAAAWVLGTGGRMDRLRARARRAADTEIEVEVRRDPPGPAAPGERR